MLSFLRRSAPKLRLKLATVLCNSDPLTTRRRHSTTTGLYGFDHLKSPKGFQRFVDDAIERSVILFRNKIPVSVHHILISLALEIFLLILFFRSGELVEYISGMPASAEIIRAMDEISNTVCINNYNFTTVRVIELMSLFNTSIG